MAISRMTDRVGQVLGGRYRLVAPIGTGASASVYLADDVTLRRRVAVKLLHDALADDAAFLKRFRAEAQAAAALNHPHIMAVYDWGHGDVPYLVTEYLGGGSLRSMLDLGRRLSLSQALLMGLEASRGLEYAHKRGFVHRDIKPANLLFDEEGRLRIADFGLARALAEAAWTEPMGAVLGTARYASPEQARGETLDGRSDVYSLALVIVEAVTGRVPFSTDTTIGTLMARVDQPLPVDAELGPLADALRQAGSPDPAQRPDATRFGSLLMGAAAELDRPEPLPLAGAMAFEGVDVDDRDPTDLYVPERAVVADTEPDIMFAPPGTTSDGITILHEGEGRPETRRVERGKPGGDGPGRRGRRAERKAGRRAAQAAEKEEEARRKAAAALLADEGAEGRRRGRWPVVVVVALVLAALVGGGAFWWYRVRVPTFTVPELVGTNVDGLDSAIDGTEWVVERTDTRVDATVPGQILAQDPTAGMSLARGQTLAITVSLGPTLVDVPPDLAGRPLPEVTDVLTGVGLGVGDVTRTFDEAAPTDTVLSLAPGTPGQEPKGGTVGLVVSAGPAPRTVPGDLAGQSVDAATAELKSLGLKAATKAQSSETVAEGTVMDVTPGGGTQVPRDSTVTLVVSSGPPTVQVPDVSGLTAAAAATQLQAAGLVVTSTQGSPANKVTGTTPAKGTTVRKGTSVVIVTG